MDEQEGSSSEEHRTPRSVTYRCATGVSGKTCTNRECSHVIRWRRYIHTVEVTTTMVVYRTSMLKQYTSVLMSAHRHLKQGCGRDNPADIEGRHQHVWKCQCEYDTLIDAVGIACLRNVPYYRLLRRVEVVTERIDNSSHCCRRQAARLNREITCKAAA